MRFVIVSDWKKIVPHEHDNYISATKRLFGEASVTTNHWQVALSAPGLFVFFLLDRQGVHRFKL